MRPRCDHAEGADTVPTIKPVATTTTTRWIARTIPVATTQVRAAIRAEQGTQATRIRPRSVQRPLTLHRGKRSQRVQLTCIVDVIQFVHDQRQGLE